jgi:DNA-binding GntR family transcriptional regulator
VSIAAASSKGTKTRAQGAATRRSAAALPAHGATVAHIVERLREDILAGRMAPGQRLVESDLTARFSVSRGPVREALRRLASDGLIDHWPNRGAVVRRLSAREISEFFQIRVELESLAARLAAESDDTAARARFAAAIKPILADGPRRLPDYLCENAAFHEALMALAGNRQLRDLSTRLHLPLIMAQVGDILTPDVLEVSVHEHRAVAAAILERDAEASASLMRAHLERARTLTLKRGEMGGTATEHNGADAA